jgi:hypothetical protein
MPGGNAKQVRTQLLRAFNSSFMEDFKPLKQGQPIRLKKVAAYAETLA